MSNEETKLFKCSICGKEFKSLKSLNSHVGHHVRSGKVESARGLSSLRYHYPDLYDNSSKSNYCINGTYVCECGREFSNKQSFVAHCGHCEIHLGYKPKKRGSNITDWWNKLKEEDPEKFQEIHSKAGLSGVKASIEKYGMNCLAKFSSTPSEKKNESHKKQSETRKRKYLSGELTPAEGIGRGYGSYFNSLYIRSSYELIYVAYLCINSIEFSYESIRVKYNNKSYISDFYINNEIIEVKGVISEIPKVKSAFESNGYKIRFINPEDINKIKIYLRGIINIDELLSILKDSNKSKKKLLWTIDKKSMNILYKIIDKSDNVNSYNDLSTYNIIENKKAV